MANYKKFIHVSATTNVGEGQTYATEAAKWEAQIAPYIVGTTTENSKYFKSIIFREATGEIYNRGKVFGVSAETAKELTDLKSMQTVLVSNGLVTESGNKGAKTYTWALASDKVSYAKTVGEGESAVTDKIIQNATNVQAAIKELDAAIDGINTANLTYKTIALTAEEIAALNDANVKEAYKTVKVDTEGTETQVGDTIKVWKDSSLKSADFVDKNASNTAGQFLKLVYVLANGEESTVYVDMSALVEQSEVENGIQQKDGKLSVKVDETNNEKNSAETSEAFLSVTSDGIKVTGIKDEIDRKINALDLASTDANAIAKDAKEYVQTTISETDGKVKNEGVAVTYGTFAAGEQTDANKGIATVEDAKAYVDAQVSGKNVSAEGDDYVSASAANNKVTVETNVQDFTLTTGTVPEWNADGSAKTAKVAPTLAGVENALADSSDIASAITGYTDAAIAVAKAEIENDCEWAEF